MDFLSTPSNLSKYDLDRLVSLLIALRQKWLGVEPEPVTGVNGEMVCECLVPKIYGSIRTSEIDIDNVRTDFAQRLAPMVKDKFISRFEYDMAESRHKTEIVLATLEERNRNKANIQLALEMYGHRTK